AVIRPCVLVDAVAQRRQHGAVLRSAPPLAAFRGGRGQRSCALGSCRHCLYSAYVRSWQGFVRREHGATCGTVLCGQRLCHSSLAGGARLQPTAARCCRLDLPLRSPDRAAYFCARLRLWSRDRADALLPLLRDVRSGGACNVTGSVVESTAPLETVATRGIDRRA